jgi:dipeptidyl aminopeptidase/acylaminoacyl peptidase
MPIVGPGETANDTYIDQLVASAEAAVDKAVDLGIADRQRIAVGGHSYGAFMTANLLAHSDLFAAGIARSGAYNRSLTPFGFQNESRTWHAHKIKEPILLIHGEADDNSGTFPIRSERFYMALKGHGAQVRYVTLPHEAHGYLTAVRLKADATGDRTKPSFRVTSATISSSVFGLDHDTERACRPSMSCRKRLVSFPVGALIRSGHSC